MSDWAPVVHTWQPYAHHEEAYIVGNRDGLIRLRNAIDVALRPRDTSDTTVRTEVFIADGEGYDLIIQLVHDTDRLAVPYTADYAREHDESDSLKPWETA